MANVVGDRFQITIGKKVREELGVKPGDHAVERVEDGRLVVYFVPQPHTESLLGVLRNEDTAPVRDWDAFRDQVWAQRAAEIMEALRSDSDRHRDEPDR